MPWIIAHGGERYADTYYDQVWLSAQGFDLEEELGGNLLGQHLDVPVAALLGDGQQREHERAAVRVVRHVQGKGQQPDHHAFIGLGRVACNHHRVVRIDVAVHVGDLQLGFVDGGFQCHGGLSLGKVSVKAGSVPLLPRQRPWRRVLLPLGDSICLR